MTAVTVKVYGLLNSETFHVARCCAEDLFEKFPDKFHSPEITPMLECEWNEFVSLKKIEIRGDTWAYSDSVMCFLGDNFEGNHEELLRWAHEEFSYEDFRPEPWYAAVAREEYRDYFLKNQHMFTYMNITIDGEDAGQLLFELESDICPKTSANFKALCTGEKGSLPSGLSLTYQGCLIHRVVPNGWIQGGDKGEMMVILTDVNNLAIYNRQLPFMQLTSELIYDKLRVGIIRRRESGRLESTEKYVMRSK